MREQISLPVELVATVPALADVLDDGKHTIEQI